MFVGRDEGTSSAIAEITYAEIHRNRKEKGIV
jgi:hypothetical protein